MACVQRMLRCDIKTTFKLHFEIPDAIFKRPMILANIVIPPETVLPDKITVDMTANIEEAIKSVTGLEMRVSVAEPSEEP